MTEQIKIASAQSPVGRFPSVNGPQVRRLMRAAADAGACLIHFPEGAVSGYPADPNTADPAALRHQLELITRLAGDLGIWVVVGSDHHLTPPHLPHNSLYVISAQGELVGRYDKRLCSHTEITKHYSPGFEPLVFDIDGFRFGCALCIEINFPEIFLDYRALDVDCVLFSTFSKDPIFEILARAHAAANTSWISVSVPAHHSTTMPAGVIGPHGYRLASCPANGTPAVTTVDLDRCDPALDIALNKARPWRAQARSGTPYRPRRVDDPRSSGHTRF
ncbi:carbon-nitrogen hydrolase family protein [Actinomadura sp. KC06]|uniref:carbon-nitrogen hydrolase family protein n=1 Tax=Actinomadura sp. KC06 TaxID=2530369 RepID=UPI001A9DACA3|nr:carbon-nitrogen hydrolase family protein [Actinomadura sp. KC06]